MVLACRSEGENPDHLHVLVWWQWFALQMKKSSPTASTQLRPVCVGWKCKRAWGVQNTWTFCIVCIGLAMQLEQSNPKTCGRLWPICIGSSCQRATDPPKISTFWAICVGWQCQKQQAGWLELIGRGGGRTQWVGLAEVGSGWSCSRLGWQSFGWWQMLVGSWLGLAWAGSRWLGCLSMDRLGFCVLDGEYKEGRGAPAREQLPEPGSPIRVWKLKSGWWLRVASVS